MTNKLLDTPVSPGAVEDVLTAVDGLEPGEALHTLVMAITIVASTAEQGITQALDEVVDALSDPVEGE